MCDIMRLIYKCPGYFYCDSTIVPASRLRTIMTNTENTNMLDEKKDMSTTKHASFQNSLDCTARVFSGPTPVVIQESMSIQASGNKESKIRSFASQPDIRTEVQTTEAYFGIKAQLFTGKTLDRITKPVCITKGVSQYDTSFTKKHAIITTDFELNEAKTNNEYFARKLSAENLKYLDDHISKSNAILVSPASCRTLYGTYDDLHTRWIMGKGESVEKILDCLIDRTKVCTPCMTKWHVLISRLAPADYHRFHAPFAFKLLSQKTVGNESSSVDVTMINSKHAVYSRNHRVILQVRPDNNKLLGDIAYIVIVGASCVNSITLRVENNANVKIGDELGHFEFGGSTLLTLICPPSNNKIQIHQYADISNMHRRPVELYTEVGVPILKERKEKCPVYVKTNTIAQRLEYLSCSDETKCMEYNFTYDGKIRHWKEMYGMMFSDKTIIQKIWLRSTTCDMADQQDLEVQNIGDIDSVVNAMESQVNSYMRQNNPITQFRIYAYNTQGIEVHHSRIVFTNK